MSIIVFKIETIPDIEGGRKLYELQDLSDKEVANVMFYKRRQETENSELLRLHLHRICSISIGVRDDTGFKVLSLGNDGRGEGELIQRFYDAIDAYAAPLHSWSGSDFALPVLHYRSLIHGLRAPRYWAEEDEAISPDLKGMLAGFSAHADVPLDEFSCLLGLPGNMLMSHDKVWDTYRHAGVETIRNASEVEVVNTYLVYLRFQQFLGQLSQNEYMTECQLVRDSLQQEQKAHLTAFLSAAWPE